MNKFIVVIFPDDAKADQGSHALQTLDGEGSIGLYGLAVVSMAKGTLSIRKSVEMGLLGVAVDAFVRGLVRLISVPVGVDARIDDGALIGSFGDLLNLGVSSDFLRSISMGLVPETIAIVAEIAEDWVTPVDTRMETLGGLVLRESRSDFEAEQLEKEVIANKAELARLKAEYAEAEEERRAKLKTKIDAADAKLKGASERAQARLQSLEKETEVKIKALQTQASQAKAGAKARIKLRRASLLADGQRRATKLKQAWELTQDTLRR